MDVETPGLSSSFLLSYSDNSTVIHTELRSEANRGSEMDVHSDTPEVGDLKYPFAGDRKCAEMVDPVVSAPSSEHKLRECEGSLVSEATILNKMQENCPSQAAMKVQKVYRSYRTRRMLADSAVVAEELWYIYFNSSVLCVFIESFFFFFFYLKIEIDVV